MMKISKKEFNKLVDKGLQDPMFMLTTSLIKILADMQGKNIDEMGEVFQAAEDWAMSEPRIRATLEDGMRTNFESEGYDVEID